MVGDGSCQYHYLKIDRHKGEEGSEGTEEAKVEGLGHLTLALDEDQLVPNALKEKVRSICFTIYQNKII